jgi:hypothetical protein
VGCEVGLPFCEISGTAIDGFVLFVHG